MMKKLVTSLLIAAVVVSITPIGASAEWKQDSNGWWYKNGKSWLTGWKEIDGNWYYFDSNGYMVTNDKVDGYFVNSNGVWTNSITIEEAKQLILKEDSNFINNNIYTNDTTKKLEFNKEINSNNLEQYVTKNWDIPKEDYYEILLNYYYGDDVVESIGYLVGKQSKNVYAIPNQGGKPIYQIEHNKKVNAFKDKQSATSSDWH